MDNVKILEVKQSIFASNDEQAAQLRQSLKEKKIFLLNLMSAPGSGKTTTLRSTIAALKDELRIGVMEADIDSDVDAKAIAAAGAKAIQLHTGGMCHLDAEMTRQGLEGLGPQDVDLVVLEVHREAAIITAATAPAAIPGTIRVVLTATVPVTTAITAIITATIAPVIIPVTTPAVPVMISGMAVIVRVITPVVPVTVVPADHITLLHRHIVHTMRVHGHLRALRAAGVRAGYIPHSRLCSASLSVRRSTYRLPIFSTTDTMSTLTATI